MPGIFETNTFSRFYSAALVVLVIVMGLGFTPASAHDLAQTGTIIEPEVVRFSSTTVNKNLPDQAIPEIDLRLWGGGYPGCLDQPISPVIDYNTDNLDQTGTTFIATCGWQPDEIIKVTLMDPEGKFFTSQVKAVPARLKKDVYQANIYFQPGIDAPEGPYRFTIEGSVTLKAKVYFNRPMTARMYVIPADRFDPTLAAMGGTHHLRLTGFLPDEPVRLMAYTFKSTRIQFYGWQDFTTDRFGQLIVETDLPDIDPDTEMYFYAYARETHSVHLERFTREGLSKTRQFDLDLFCPGAQPPRLDGAGWIEPAPGIKLDLHQQPGFGARVTTSIPSETQIRLFGHPKCIDHVYWWQVYISDPVLFGWVPESFLGKYQVAAVE